MMTYYELLEDGTIGRSTPNKDLAGLLGFYLCTEKEIVYGYNGKRYFKGNEPAQPEPTAEEKVAELEARYQMTRWQREGILSEPEKYSPLTVERAKEIENLAKFLREEENHESGKN